MMTAIYFSTAVTYIGHATNGVCRQSMYSGVKSDVRYAARTKQRRKVYLFDDSYVVIIAEHARNERH